MFFKKKDNIPALDYTNWEKDLGFLNLILQRKKRITIDYFINVFSNQKTDKDYINDEELEPLIQKVIEDVLKQLGVYYKNYIIKKYFGTLEGLIAFITEDVYVDLTTEAINRNLSKMQRGLQSKIINNLQNMNNKT